MTTDQDKALEALKHVGRAHVDAYEDWVKVGLILKRTGCTLGDWEAWSRQSTKYVEGDCAKKWAGFNDANSAIATIGTLIAWAKQDSPTYKPTRGGEARGPGRPLSWDEEVITHQPVPAAPADWDGSKDLITYLETVYRPGDIINYVFDAHQDDKGKWKPVSKGAFMERDMMVKVLQAAGEIPFALGDYNQAAGGWIRANPVDGKGVNNDNITDCRFALIESDNLPLEQQLATIRRLQLPCVAIVHSGGKSIHAIVRIDAGTDRQLYRDRIEYLFSVLETEDFPVDKACKNPARLSRMPGLQRGEDTQRLIAVNAGRPSWGDWEAFSKAPPPVTLPVPVNVSVWIQQEPEAPDQILKDTFDVGDKVCLIAPPKARKSFFFLQMLTSIAAGVDFLAWHVVQPRNVILVQFEVRSHHYHRRVKAMCATMGIDPASLLDRFWIINARGWDIDKIYEVVTTHAIANHTQLIAFDPLYKMHAGDENSAEDMKPLLAKFDVMAESNTASLCFVHHDPKGSSGDRNIRDRGAGSNVVARDVDCSITMTPHAHEEQTTAIEVMGRNYPPQMPIKCEWKEGRFEHTGSVDPADLAPAAAGRKAKPPSTFYVDKALEILGSKVLQAVQFRDQLRSGLEISREKVQSLILDLEGYSKIARFETAKFPRKTYYGIPSVIADYKEKHDNPELGET